jgi:hypothetical protein
MTDRIRLDDLTSDQLDALYEQLEAAEETESQRQLATAREAFASATTRAARAEVTVARVRALGDRWAKAGPPPLGASLARWVDRRLVELNTALNETTSAATEATGHVYLSTGCLHGDHAYCQGMTGLNGSKRPGECKHCGARCICGCHTATEPEGSEPCTGRVCAGSGCSHEQAARDLIQLTEEMGLYDHQKEQPGPA